MEFYFFAEDLEALDQKIKELDLLVREAGKDMGESCQQSAETYHDNAPYEEAVRSFEMYSRRLAEFQRIRNQVRVISPPANADMVKAGCWVRTINLGSGAEKIIKVGSYIVARDCEISYVSPLARLLTGAKIGEVREGLIGNGNVEYKVLDISLSQP